MGKKVNIKDVAREAGVSIATVSYVINDVNKVNCETRERVKEVIDRLGYQPNINARSLVKKESRIIGIIVPVNEKDKETILLDNPFYLEFLSSAENKASLQRYSTMNHSIDEEKVLVRHINSGTLAGIIVLGSANDFVYNTLREVDIPVVVVDQAKTSNKFCYVSTDDEMGAFLATEYLIKNGHKETCFLIGGFEDTLVYKGRLEGYKSALLKYGIEYKPGRVVNIDISYEGGIEAANKVLSLGDDITGIFVMSDIAAMGLIRGFYDRNISVPKDMSVIGFDNIRDSKYFIPQLTTIDQHIGSKADEAVEVIIGINKKDKHIIENIKENNVITIPVNLVERESVVKSNVSKMIC